MKKTKKQSLNKKPIVAIVISGFMIAAIGGVLAFRSDITRFINGLVLGDHGLTMTYTEDFTSPDDWTPCTTTPKTVIATNSDADPVVVRVSYNDYWKSRQDLSYLPLKQNGIDVAVINFANEEDWTLNEEDGWYYYKEPLQTGQSTSSFIASVTFNCAYNLGSNTLNACDSQGNCTTPINPYANAKYHVEVTVQTIKDGTDWPESSIAAEDPCHSNLLYYEIACHTNGPDNNINFMAQASSSNGAGVNTRKTTANDAHPVYYYRGTVNNNLVIWADNCWRIIRTTSTGGVKLLYSGPAKTNTVTGAMYCQIAPSDNDRGPNYGRFTAGRMAATTDSPVEAYYMFGDDITDEDNIYYDRGSVFAGHGTHGWNYDTGFSDDIAHIGTALTYSNGKYAPAGDVVDGDPVGWFQESYDTIPADVQQSHIYSCDQGQWGYERGYEYWCKRGAVHLYSGRAFALYNGELTIEDAFNNMQRNTYDSNAKKLNDSWFANHLTAYANQLEDTVFCADRRYSGMLRDAVWTTGSKYSVYGATANFDSPSVSCPRVNDSYTVSSALGNGALTYPVGLLTVDEALMAGTVWGIVDYNSWITYGGTTYTMSPYYIEGMDNVTIFVAGVSNGDPLEARIRPTEYWYIRPVVSLKPNTRFIHGDGTSNNPYVIR